MTFGINTTKSAKRNIAYLMINLFEITNYRIDTSQFANHLHDVIVMDFADEFANFVGAKYACPLSSATSAIFLCLSLEPPTTITTPSIMPPVVANAILLAGHNIQFNDDVDWVGEPYVMHQFDACKIVDSAQAVRRNQFHEYDDNDLMIFSFYPTKPVGSIDGGMVVSNNKDVIDKLKVLSMNGMSSDISSWDRKVVQPGWKMYLNSVQAYVARKNLRTLAARQQKLQGVRDRYNKAFGYENTSDHLYRIHVKDNIQFVKNMRAEGIICGIHYHALHLMDCYRQDIDLPHSERESKTTISIPFHHNLTDTEIKEVIQKVLPYVIKI